MRRRVNRVTAWQSSKVVRGVCIALLALAVSAPVFARGPWLLVRTQQDVAELRRDGQTIATFPGLSFGRGGISKLHLRGDETTPRGDFRVTRINRDSNFYIFIGINYPTIDHVEKAHHQGVIGDAEYRRMLDFGLRHGRMPQDSVLGGQIGFHGIGIADPAIHKRFHWTEGCVAMTDEQITELTNLIDVGSRVVIK